jgi:hypothetical protein
MERWKWHGRQRCDLAPNISTSNITILCEAVLNGDIPLHKISWEEQEADIFPKPLVECIFIYLRQKIIGW